VGEGDGKIAR
jgi:hypothetical protein